MNKLTAAGLALFASLSLPAHADDSLVGRYSGHSMVRTPVGERPIPVELVVKSLDGSMVKGSMKSWSTNCRGAELLMEGTYANGTLAIASISTHSGPVKCGLEWTLNVDGATLAGTTASGYHIRLTKSR